ncbi:hypothetical protein D8674_021841 [Pyrus ussuriensis x Pyrus communis]|uniref:Uncharacterized protein n=1 Tax=Pyrus ussuriensis x Pyrus communis TaxID=2448454 RepID=A0A5N5GK99_9ROSA|nr:hypothetical protein D8674_021841 [Pyrus ussuriensis x Pyrus communis]
MSRDPRHLRQASQILPPELIAGELHDLGLDTISTSLSAAATATAESSKNPPPKTHEQESSTHSSASKKKPPTPQTLRNLSGFLSSPSVLNL